MDGMEEALERPGRGTLPGRDIVGGVVWCNLVKGVASLRSLKVVDLVQGVVSLRNLKVVLIGRQACCSRSSGRVYARCRRLRRRNSQVVSFMITKIMCRRDTINYLGFNVAEDYAVVITNQQKETPSTTSSDLSFPFFLSNTA